jgi:PAS domain S-box-containing protein
MTQANKQSEQNLEASELRYRRLFETAQDGILILDGITGEIKDVNPFLLRMLGYTHKELMGKQLWEIGLFKDIEASRIAFDQLKRENYIRYEDLPLKTKDGLRRDVEFVSNSYNVDQSEVIQCNIRDITDRKRAETAQLQSEGKFHRLVEQSSDGIVVIDEKGKIIEWNHGQEEITGLPRDKALGHSLWDVQYQMTPDELKKPELLVTIKKKILRYLSPGKTNQLSENLETTIIHSDGKPREIQTAIFQFITDSGIFAGITVHNITEQNQHIREMEAILAVSAAMRMTNSIEEMLSLLLKKTLVVMNLTAGAIWLFNPTTNEIKLAVSQGWNVEEHPVPPEKPNEGINGFVLAQGEPYISRDIYHDKRLPKVQRDWAPSGLGCITVPIKIENEVIGTFNVNVLLPREISPNDIRLLTTLSEIAGNAINRMQTYDRLLRNAQQLAALHSIDISINASDDLNITLNILLDKVIGLLKVSAADFLLFNPYTLQLEYSAGKGFRSNAITQSRLQLGEGYAGHAALERQTRKVADLRLVGSDYGRKDLLEGEEFVAYFGVPLITKNKVIGVLDIFNRSPLNPDKEWLDFMEALASQAAIAIGSATLFTDLQNSNIQLLQAYDKTIEGWSRAMDIRDHETEGHTQRVTELTIRLAQKFGLNDEEIAQIRRGALLHDMGKLGIPDAILLKPGPLTDEEWVIMRQHPRIAFDMLSPIEFLRPALDIPYCHHEKWDGTGYPRGLKGEQIPIAARLFAIVDVWDALRSDRPYRKAWDEEKIFEYLKSLSGTHFDPKVEQLFVRMMNTQQEPKTPGRD